MMQNFFRGFPQTDKQRLQTDHVTKHIWIKEKGWPENDVVASRLLSNGGAHLLQIPWQEG